MSFIGELYRRKILSETILNTVFESLLGIHDLNRDIDDLVIEGAINLMNKAGETYEQGLSKSTDDKKSKEKKD